jgi:DNA polymerase III delta prime subunit
MSIKFTEKFVEPVSHHLWIQDYEPQSLDQVIGNPMVIETINSFLNNDHLPNLILCGPNGCGKSITSKMIATRYLGTHITNNHLEIIGSIYRGKNVVTEKTDKKKSNDSSADSPNIINFIRKKTVLPKNKCRIVTIYDFDCMTDEAQMALRRIIEIYSQKIRFIFICNNLSNVIEAIQSRTLILKFFPISINDITNRLKEIMCLRHVVLSDEIYHAIGIISHNDLKQAINYLQVFANSRIINETTDNDKIMEHFYHIFNIPSIENINQIIDHCLNHQGLKALAILNNMINNGYNVTDILDIMIKVLIFNKEIKEKDRAIMIEQTIKIICICEQSSSVIHLYRLIVMIQKELS